MYRILVINPGSTSTEVSIFEEETEILNAKIVHPVEELRKYSKVLDQLPYRSNVVKSQINKWDIRKGVLSAVVGRSGVSIKESGTYKVTQKMVEDVRAGKFIAEHAAILGCLIAKEIADEHGISEFIAQPSPLHWSPIVNVSVPCI